MNRKILFGDNSALEIVVSMPEGGKMAVIAYNTLLDFIDEELLDHPDLSLQTDEDLTELEEDDELTLDDLDEEEFGDDDFIDLDADEEELDEEELEEELWGEDDLDDRL